MFTSPAFAVAVAVVRTTLPDAENGLAAPSLWLAHGVLMAPVEIEG